MKESDTEEDEERGKKESSRLGEGRLVFLEVNMSLQLADVTSRTSSQDQEANPPSFRRQRERKKKKLLPVSCFPVGLVQINLINLLLCQTSFRC